MFVNSFRFDNLHIDSMALLEKFKTLSFHKNMRKSETKWLQERINATLSRIYNNVLYDTKSNLFEMTSLLHRSSNHILPCGRRHWAGVKPVPLSDLLFLCCDKDIFLTAGLKCSATLIPKNSLALTNTLLCF